MTTSTASSELEELSINTIRTLAMDAVQKANSGHPGTAMALAPLAYTLFTRVMRHNPANPDWPDRDRFVLSAGHASMLLYSMLYLTGYPLTLDDIKHFRQVDSPTAGHPERKYTPGHRGHHRSARPGPVDVGGPGAGRADDGRALQPPRQRDRRPPHVRHRQRRRHPGGRGLGGLFPGRALGTRAPDHLLRQQPHPAGQRGGRGDDRGRGRPLRGLRLARDSTWARTSRWRTSSAPPARPWRWRTGPR